MALKVILYKEMKILVTRCSLSNNSLACYDILKDAYLTHLPEDQIKVSLRTLYISFVMNSKRIIMRT
ncbi:MAG: hypothetical protein AB7V56_04585 [Candidatus Nitrosocosmicus sp.]